MKIPNLWFLPFLLLLLLYCTPDTALNSLPDDKIVVQAYIYSDKEAQSLQLNYTFPLNSGQDFGQPVENAAATVYINEKPIPFYHDSNHPGVYSSFQELLQPHAGDQLRLEVYHQDKLISATATMPPVPQNLKLSASSMRFPHKDIADLTTEEASGLSELNIDITWDSDNLGQHYYFARLENVDPTPQRLLVHGNTILSEPSNFETDLKTTTGFSVGFRDVTHTGAHVVYVYRVSREYADLYGTLFDQNTRSINMPVSNIVNGLGIFTGFTCASDTFYVVQK